ncbi:hypothetical protein [Methanoculleus formosensis]|uniref:hypothetical protein n=1 Tax=Methanoculleus formosensis TaxID=2590886 RepID=UPI0021C21362|nr:hypothetical protein [Methanoculleus sp. Afa-1]
MREGEDFVPSLDEKGIDVGSRAHISSSKYIATRPINLIPEHAPYRTVPEKAEDRERPWFFIVSLSGGAAPVSCLQYENQEAFILDREDDPVPAPTRIRR